MPVKSKHKTLNTKITGKAFLRLELLKNELEFSNFTEAINFAVTRTIKIERLKK